jgi:hypothetical protein
MIEDEARAGLFQFIRRRMLARRGLGQIVEHLVDQRGGRQRGVIANAATRVRDHQPVAR